MADVKAYMDLAQSLIDRDKDRDDMFARQDRIWRVEWDLPPELREMGWVKAVKSTDGHDALRGTARILSARVPSVSVWPTGTSPEDQERADKLERALRWFLNVAFQRGQTTALRDVVMSAAKYDEVCGQIVYMPYQKQLLEGFGAGITEDSAAARRMKAMERSGPFSVIVRNPRSVHTLYSEYGMEAVAYTAIWPAKNVVSFYGNRAKDIRTKELAGEAANYYAIFDVCDYDKRVVVAIPRDSDVGSPPKWTKNSKDLPKEAITLMDEDNDLNFIPWICRVGGTSLESDSENTHIPMLYSVDKANQFDIQNTIQTLVLSEAITHAAAPRDVKMGPGADNIYVAYGSPDQSVVTGPGQDYKRLPPLEIDQGLFNLSEWISGKVSKSTIPPVLQGGQVASETFATLNLTVQSGMITIDPYKKLAEQWLSDACIQMLLWVKKVGDPIVAFEREKEEVTGKEKTSSFTIEPDDINEKGMRIDVTLEAEVPVDKVAKINGAAMLQKMGIPKREAYEEVGFADASALMDEARYEAMEEFFLQRFFTKLNQKDQIDFQTKLTEAQTAIQLMAKQKEMEMQMAAQQAQQEAQAQAQMAAQGGGMPPQGGGGVPFMMPGANAGARGLAPEPGTPPGSAGETEGPMWNPAMGGAPPAMAQPGMTREMQTGETGTSEVM